MKTERYQTDEGALSPERDNWWLVIAARVIGVLLHDGILLLSIYIIPMSLDDIFWVSPILLIVVILLTLASGVAVYFDRQFVVAASDWRPSGLYYLMAVPLIPLIPEIIAVAYLYNRHKLLGVP